MRKRLPLFVLTLARGLAAQTPFAPLQRWADAVRGGQPASVAAFHSSVPPPARSSLPASNMLRMQG